MVIAGDTLVVFGFLIIFLVFRKNTFAAATIEVAPDQKVISTGVRHFMFVVRIPRQILRKKYLFVEKPPDNDNRHGNEHQQSHQDPSASGVPKIMTNAPAYRGWRTIA